jgi:hypothetical protein
LSRQESERNTSLDHAGCAAEELLVGSLTGGVCGKVEPITLPNLRCPKKGVAARPQLATCLAESIHSCGLGFPQVIVRQRCPVRISTAEHLAVDGAVRGAYVDDLREREEISGLMPEEIKAEKRMNRGRKLCRLNPPRRLPRRL